VEGIIVKIIRVEIVLARLIEVPLPEIFMAGDYFNFQRTSGGQSRQMYL
jgi:hypothetical protein